VRRRAREESGFALVSAVAVLLVLLLLTGAAAAASIAAKSGQSRSVKGAQALQAAEAAANIGWERINLARVDTLSVTTPCLQLSAGSVVKVAYSLVDVNNVHWCPSQTVVGPGASSASYQVSELTLDNVLGVQVRYVVGTATVGDVTRRVALKLGSSTSGGSITPFGSYALDTLSDLLLGNATQVAGAGARSNGDITLQDLPHMCHVSGGNITPGPGKQVFLNNNATTCGGSDAPAAAPLVLNPITEPALNDDLRLQAPPLCKLLTALDPCTYSAPSDVQWDPLKLRLVIMNQATVKLTGNNYVFCYLDLKAQTKLIVAPANGQAVKITFRSPDQCPGGAIDADGTQLWLENQSFIDNRTGRGANGIQLLFVGSSTKTSKITIDTAAKASDTGLTSFNALIYAPLSDLTMINQGELFGAVAAKSVTMTAQARVTYDATTSGFTVPGGPTSTNYPKANYAQCSSATAPSNNPRGGC
jgi:Tfp pilus assembly protein PilX